MLVSELGIVILIKLVQSANEPLPLILVTELGIVILVILVLFRKQSPTSKSPIDMTLYVTEFTTKLLKIVTFPVTIDESDERTTAVPVVSSGELS